MKLTQRIKQRRLEWFVFLLGIALTAVILWPYCTMTVEAGHVGVYFSRFFGGTVLDKVYREGFHFMLPWDTVIQYDTRLQSKNYNISALTRGGLDVSVNMSVLWLLEPEQASTLHVGSGPDYRERVIDPAVISTVRSIIGSYEQNQLYDGNPIQLQENVLALLNDTLINSPFTIHSILIREVKLPKAMSDAISEKFVAEQNVLAARYRVLESIEYFKKDYVEAEGIRLAQSIVNEGMSEAYLRYIGIQTTRALAESHNAKLVIIGDKDGLPLLLNPDMLETSPELPDGILPEEYIPPGEEGARMNNFIDTYDRVQQHLHLMDDILGSAINEFPQADTGFDDTNLPQGNQVPQTSEEGEKEEPSEEPEKEA